MKLFDVVMNLAKKHTKIHEASLTTDLYIGVQFGIEQALLEMAKLPELENDPGMKSIVDRLNNNLPALPLAAIKAA